MRDALENELGGAFTKLKSTHFAEGQKYGFLATVIPQEKYRIIIGNPAWTYVVAPPNLGAYAAAALVAGVSAAQREQLVAQHKEEQMVYADAKNSSSMGWTTTRLPP